MAKKSGGGGRDSRTGTYVPKPGSGKTSVRDNARKEESRVYDPYKAPPVTVKPPKKG